MTWIELKPQKGKGSQFAIQIQIIISSLSQMVKSAIWNNFDCWGVRNTPSPSLPTLFCKWFWKTVEACAYFLKQNMWKMLSWTISMESIVVIVWIYLILFHKKNYELAPLLAQLSRLLVLKQKWKRHIPDSECGTFWRYQTGWYLLYVYAPTGTLTCLGFVRQPLLRQAPLPSQCSKLFVCLSSSESSI